MVTPIHTRLCADATGARISQARPSKRLSAALFKEETLPRDAKPSTSMPPGGAMPPRVDVMALSQLSTAVPKDLGHQPWQEIAPLTRSTKAAVSTPAQVWPPLILDNRRLATIIVTVTSPRRRMASARRSLTPRFTRLSRSPCIAVSQITVCDDENSYFEPINRLDSCCTPQEKNSRAGEGVCARCNTREQATQNLRRI